MLFEAYFAFAEGAGRRREEISFCEFIFPGEQDIHFVHVLRHHDKRAIEYLCKISTGNRNVIRTGNSHG